MAGPLHRPRVSRGPDLEVPPEVVLAVPAAISPAMMMVESPAADPQALREVERQHIVAVLKRTGSRVDGPKGAARVLNSPEYVMPEPARLLFIP